ncbi:MAG: ABC transporter ATP-binding protein [Bacteroidota bacterium]
MSAPLLEIKDLKTHFYTQDGIVPAVDGVDISVSKGQMVALVGESGCGKSVTMLATMGLIPWPPGKIVHGEIIFENDDLARMNQAELRRIRGNEISMIFQEPMTSLNPVFTVGDQIAEALMLHLKLGKTAARARAVEMLRLVRIPDAEKRIDDYPHQLSGGMRQRVMIAMALSCNPKLLIADEPTTALDVTIQAQILDLLRRLQSEFGMAVILITHDLGVVAELVEKVTVMYAGKIVEEAEVKELYRNPSHPYAQGLLASIPKADRVVERLRVIPGAVPNPLHMPSGCRFHPRCEQANERCRTVEPEARTVGSGHIVRCWLY